MLALKSIWHKEIFIGIPADTIVRASNSCWMLSNTFRKLTINYSRSSYSIFHLVYLVSLNYNDTHLLKHPTSNISSRKYYCVPNSSTNNWAVILATDPPTPSPHCQLQSSFQTLRQIAATRKGQINVANREKVPQGSEVALSGIFWLFRKERIATYSIRCLVCPAIASAFSSRENFYSFTGIFHWYFSWVFI